MKTCSNCKIVKPFTDFYRDKSKANGCSSRCKVCTSLMQKVKRPVHICPFCGVKHLPESNQKYCSLRCALWSRILKVGDSDCWEWSGTKEVAGYGIFYFGGKLIKSHRGVMLDNGYDIQGLDVCHKCDNPGCCNPNHLFLGTALDNIRDMNFKGRAVNLKGEEHGRAKLTTKDVLEIKSLFDTKSIKDIALKFGVSTSTIKSILKGKTWKSLVT